MPWAVAFVALLALAAMAAGRNIGAARGGTLDAPLNALPQYARMPELGVPMDADLRYDMGRIAEVAGRADVAAAQADTILREQPKHLLGLVLAIKAASLQGDAAKAADARRRLAAAAPAERARGLDEYQRHGNDIDAALRLASVPAPTTPGARP
jgi:hypothetical protein